MGNILLSKDKSVPIEYHDKVIRTIIDKEVTLAEHYNYFKENYEAGPFNFKNYINTYIIDDVSEKAFTEYLDVLLSKYAATNINDASLFTIDNLLNHLYGHSWQFRNNFILGKNKKHVSFYRFSRLTLKSILPYFIGNVFRKEGRYFYYNVLNFDDAQILEYENKYQKANKSHTSSLVNAESIEIDCDEKKYGQKSLNELIDYMYSYIDEFVKMDRDLSKIKFRKIFENSTDETIRKAFASAFSIKKANKVLSNAFNSKINETAKMCYKTNKQELELNKDNYCLFYCKNGKYFKNNIDMSDIKNKYLKQEISEYIRFIFKTNPNTEYHYETTPIIDMVKYMEEHYSVNHVGDIDEIKMITYLKHLEIERKLSPISVKNYKGKIAKYFDFIISEENNLPVKPMTNVVEAIKMNNTNELVNTTPDVPEEIYTFLDKHIDEISNSKIALIYRILMETGWRFSEVAALTTDSYEYKADKGIAILKTRVSKTKKSRILNGFGEYIQSAISERTYKSIISYINSSESIRKKFDTNLLFFQITKNNIYPITSHEFNRTINRFLKKNNIKTIDGSAWNSSSRQARKHVAIELISNDATLSEVQKQLGHITQKTTAQYYAAVKKKKIAEMDSKFYKEKFEMLIDEDKLALYTEEERRTLYIDFCLGTREVELGQCTKHPSEGRCVENGNMSCSTCSKMCTGKKYLPKWEKLANDSKRLIDNFIEKYKELGIPEEDYKNFREYKQEVNLYEHYTAVIKAINDKGVS